MKFITPLKHALCVLLLLCLAAPAVSASDGVTLLTHYKTGMTPDQLPDKLTKVEEDDDDIIYTGLYTKIMDVTYDTLIYFNKDAGLYRIEIVKAGDLNTAGYALDRATKYRLSTRIDLFYVDADGNYRKASDGNGIGPSIQAMSLRLYGILKCNNNDTFEDLINNGDAVVMIMNLDEDGFSADFMLLEDVVNEEIYSEGMAALYNVTYE